MKSLRYIKYIVYLSISKLWLEIKFSDFKFYNNKNKENVLQKLNLNFMFYNKIKKLFQILQK